MSEELVLAATNYRDILEDISNLLNYLSEHPHQLNNYRARYIELKIKLFEAKTKINELTQTNTENFTETVDR
jgi:hypothetical protein